MTAVEIIDSVLDTEKITGLGVIATVSKNVAENHGIEWALTYLLGCQDGAGISGNSRLADLIRKCRTELKMEFRPRD